MIPSTPPFTVPTGVNFYKNLSYGKYNNNVVDVFQPPSEVETPVILMIHGGGFRFSNKESFYNTQAERDEINEYLTAGICVINMDYRLISTKIDTEGVFKCMEDAEICLAWIEENQTFLNIDFQNLVLMGGSAGAGICQYLAFRSNSGIKGIAINEAQSGYDILGWGNVITGFNFDPLDFIIENGLTQDFVSFYGVKTIEEVQAQSFQSKYSQVDTLNKIANFTGEIWLENVNYPDTYPVDNGHVYHHPRQALAIKTAADELGVTIYADIPNLNISSSETREVFIIRNLTL